jgi:hypothetical protein
LLFFQHDLLLERAACPFPFRWPYLKHCLRNANCRRFRLDDVRMRFSNAFVSARADLTLTNFHCTKFMCKNSSLSN